MSGSVSAAAQPGSPEVAFSAWGPDEVDQTLAQRFTKQVRRHGSRVAVRSDAGCVTYEELDRRASRLARALLSHDAAPGQRVALLLAHDAPLMAAMIGVWKAGKVCVVLAPSHPDARIDTILDDAGADVLVTESTSLARCAGLARAERHTIDIVALDAGAAADDPALALDPEALACITYTSGSTGRPRGVMHTHRTILHNIRRHTNGLRYHAADRICLLSSCSAGQGFATTLGALLNGATLCPRDLAVESVVGLGDWLIREKITVYVSAATVYRQFIRTLTGREQFPDLRLVRLASEPVFRSDFHLFRSRFAADCVFVNTYSCTETGNLCRFPADRQTRLDGDAMPVGRAVEEMEITLLDESGRAVANGEEGEIVVRSRYLSPGYWNDLDQTRAVFKAVPGSDERIYHTRDLGRVLPDGSLEHRGRKDTQLKIRGYRVYPDEIQDRLCRHQAVADARVDARTDARGQARLVAYFVPSRSRQPIPGELRRHLKETLPDHMIPATFVPLEVLPRTPNGKVDRNALRALDLTDAVASDPGARPRTPTEEQLALIWAEVLDLDRVNAADNFFDVGGDSLTVTEVLCRIEEILHVDLPVTALFENPTLEAQAALIQSRLGRAPGSAVPPIVAVPRGRPLPLSFSQERTWRASQTTMGSLDYLVANGYALDGLLDHEALRRSLDEVVQRHESLRTTYTQVQDEPRQIARPAAPVEMRVVDLSCCAGGAEALEELWREEARTPIDLEQGPALRATLVRLGRTRHRLLLTYHHINSDAWSRDNLQRELGLLYAAYAAGRPSPLPDTTLHYADFAHWQRRLLRRDAALHREQLAYWRAQLDGAPDCLEMPLRKSSLAGIPAGRDCCLRWGVPAETARRLREIGRRAEATMFMTRLAVFATLLQRLTGDGDLVIGSYLTNRSRPETLGMIGFFSNLVMLRVDLSGDPTFSELLVRVRRTVLGAAAHGDLPFEELCAGLRAEHRPLPAISVIFWLNDGEETARFGSLELRRLERRQETMPWGLQVGLENRGDLLGGRCLFDGRVYGRAKVAALLSRFEYLQGQIASDPGRRLSEYRSEPPARVRSCLGLVYRKLYGKMYWRPKIGVLKQHSPQPIRLPSRYSRRPSLPGYPVVSVVTPSLNQVAFIERTIRSVLDQGYPRLEYHVQDAASTDGTREVLTRNATGLMSWESRADNGQSHALNLAFQRTGGEIMAYLNADDVLLPGALHAVVSFFLRHPQIDVVYGNRLLIDEHDLQIGRWVLPPHDDAVLPWADFVPQETLFWRRRIWDRAGARIDEEFDFAMDWDLLLRFRDAGARFARLPRFLGGFRVHPAQKTSARIHDLGLTEMQRLRERCHGRVVNPEDINRHIAWYLVKHRFWDCCEGVRLALLAAERYPAVRRDL